MQQTTVERTPGPWRVHEIDRERKFTDIHEYQVLAPQGWQDRDGTYRECGVALQLDNEADARLIAAAPALYDAARAVILLYNDFEITSSDQDKNRLAASMSALWNAVHAAGQES